MKTVKVPSNVAKALNLTKVKAKEVDFKELEKLDDALNDALSNFEDFFNTILNGANLKDHNILKKLKKPYDSAEHLLWGHLMRMKKFLKSVELEE